MPNQLSGYWKFKGMFLHLYSLSWRVVVGGGGEAILAADHVIRHCWLRFFNQLIWCFLSTVFIKGFPFLDIKIVTLNTFKINLDSFGKKFIFCKTLGVDFRLAWSFNISDLRGKLSHMNLALWTLYPLLDFKEKIYMAYHGCLSSLM